MPMDLSRYPSNWKDIALQVKTEANWTCENCNRPCRRPGESDEELIERIELEHSEWAGELREWQEDGEFGAIEIPKLTRFTLTVAHVNHNPENPDAELAAWCAPCHCRYDLKAMALKRRLKREWLGQINLFQQDTTTPATEAKGVMTGGVVAQSMPATCNAFESVLEPQSESTGHYQKGDRLIGVTLSGETKVGLFHDRTMSGMVWISDEENPEQRYLLNPETVRRVEQLELEIPTPPTVAVEPGEPIATPAGTAVVTTIEDLYGSQVIHANYGGNGVDQPHQPEDVQPLTVNVDSEGRLALNCLRTDGGTQPRGETDWNHVAELTADLESGATLPPITVFFDGENHWLADGYHRYYAHKRAGINFIAADIRQGTQREAILFSVGANANHGKRRTPEDKRRAVMRLLDDPEWGAWSDREIARRTHTSNTFVSKLRASLTVNVDSENEERTYTTKHGTTAKMQTGNIGKATERNIDDLRSVVDHRGQAAELPSLDDLFALYGAIAENVEHQPTQKYRNQFLVERTAQPSFTLKFLGRGEAWKYWNAKYHKCPELPVERRMSKPGYPLYESAQGQPQTCGQCQFSEAIGDGWYCQKHQQNYSHAENPAPTCQQYFRSGSWQVGDRLSTETGDRVAEVLAVHPNGDLRLTWDNNRTQEEVDEANWGHLKQEEEPQSLILGLAEIHYAVRKFAALNQRDWDEQRVDAIADRLFNLLQEC